MAYATNEEEELAKHMGYTINRDDRIGSTFDKGMRRVWPTRIGWQTADLIDGYYRNHEIFDDLSKALMRRI